MSIKKFARERQEKRKLLTELKNIIIEEPDKNLRKLRKYNISTVDDVINIFFNVGNMSYFLGDNDIFDFFIESSFEIISAESDNINKNDLIKYIKNYGFMSAQNYNIITYSIILKNIKKHIFNLEKVQLINFYLRTLKDLVMIPEIKDYEVGVIEALYIFNEINDYFIFKGMRVNRVYLKNIIISIINSAEINKHQYLKNIIFSETVGIVGFQKTPDQTENLRIGATPMRDEIETPNQTR